MELKAVKYHTKSKKLRPTALTDYETLRASIKKVFPKGLDEDFVIYYFEDGEPFDVETQQDFEIMIEQPRKLTLYLRNEGEQPLSFNSNEVSVVSHNTNILNESLKQQSQSLVNSIQETVPAMKKQEQRFEVTPVPESVVAETKVRKHEVASVKSDSQKNLKAQFEEKIETIVQDTTIRSDQSNAGPHDNEIQVPEQSSLIKQQISAASFEGSKVQAKSQQKPEDEQKQSSFVVFEVPKRVTNPNFVHKDKKCAICSNTQIKGSLWKSLDVVAYDICNDCYVNQKYKAHKNITRFVEVNDDGFDSRVNYSHAIRKLFDPNYKPQTIDDTIGEWITERDMYDSKVHFVNEVWKSSARIASQTLEKFDDWERQYENVASRQ